MQTFISKRPSPPSIIRASSPVSMRNSYTPITSSKQIISNQLRTPQVMRVSQHKSPNQVNPTIQIISPQVPRKITSANRSALSIKQSDVSFLSQNKFGQQSGVSYISQNKPVNTTVLDQYPTTILQTQQIIHHTFYPVPVDKDTNEILQTEKKQQTPFASSTDINQDFIDQKIQILLQKISDLTEENNQLRFEAHQRLKDDRFETLNSQLLLKEGELQELRSQIKGPSVRQSNFSAFQSQNREDLLTSQLESLSEQYKLKDLDTKRLLRDIEVLRKQMNSQPKNLSKDQIFMNQNQENLLKHQQEEIIHLKQQLNQLNQNQQRQSDTIQQKNLGYEFNQLKQENESLQQQLTLLKLKPVQPPSDQTRFKDENDRLRIQYNEMSSKLKNLEFKSEVEISQLKFKVQQLKGDISRYSAQEDRIKISEVEAEEWRSKFVRVNREYHLNQERLVLMIAEMDTFRKRFSTIVPIQEHDSAFEVEIKHFQAKLLANIENKPAEI